MKAFQEIHDYVKKIPKKVIAVVAAADMPALKAIRDSIDSGLAYAILIGDKKGIEEIAGRLEMDLNKVSIKDIPDPIEAANEAVGLVNTGQAHVLMKGLIKTADLLRVVLKKEGGIRAGKALSHVAVFEAEKINRLILMTDSGMMMYPTLEEKVSLLENAALVCKALEIPDPKAAAVCAVEVVNPKMQPTLDAAALTLMSQRGQIKGIRVEGPLGLDNALSMEAAEHKGIRGEVAGQADVLLMPNIESGNIMWKTLAYMGNGKLAGVLIGATVPVIMASRSDTAETKQNSIALGLLISSKQGG